jgi:(1->4)-alpha-D-glucan 1-alpha-D-glucosylmutase
MAKSVEDTAFYVYNRFIALNEVGGDPAAFGRSLAEFHAENARRRALTPHTLLATSTHDTKLGEDARARLYVLSEMPDEWSRWVSEWRRLNWQHKSKVGERDAPDANEEYRLYQTLLACWPDASFQPDEAFRQRLREHVRKAVNEAKRNTHWFHPDEKWMEAGDHFIDAILTPGPTNEFLASFAPKAAQIAELGVTNALVQVALKTTSPGVPDFYQGCEKWNLSLVDPDNRRLVEWIGYEESLPKLRQSSWRELLQNWSDARVKQRLTAELLRFRQENLAVFQQGDYEPLEVDGEHAERVVAFRRTHERKCVVVVVPRLSAVLGACPVGALWGDTRVSLPGGWENWRNVLTGAVWNCRSGASAPTAELFSELPLAVLDGG